MSYGSIGGSGYSDDGQQSQLLDRCAYNVQRLDAIVKELERLHSQLSAGGNVKSVTEAVRRKEQDTNRLLSTSAELMQQLAGLSSQNSALNTRRSRLIGQYKISMGKYRRLQEKILQAVRDAATRQEEEQKEQRRQEEEEAAPFARQDQLQAKADAELMQRQEEQMRGLLADIVAIEDMFKDMSAMVYEQGEAIDDIANNVTSAVENVEAGEQQLADAVVYRRKARKKKICLAVLILVILIIIGLIIYFSVRGNN